MIISKKTVSVFVLILTLLSFPVVSADEDFWVTLEPMPTARSGLGVAAVNGKIYAIGGSTASGFYPSVPGYAVLGNNDIGGIVGTNEMYDPKTGTWTSKEDMPTPRIVFATAVFQNKVYCIGGKTGDGFTGVNEVYDPETDTWQTKTSMPSEVGWVTANVVDEKIYVVSGSSNEMYDPETDTWTTKTPPPTSASFPYCVSAVFDNKIYVIGGITADQSRVLNRIYDTETDTWSYGSSPPSSLVGGEAVVTTGVFAPELIYFIGYSVSLRPGEDEVFVRVYDPRTDTWTFGEDPPTKRWDFGAAVLNDTIYIIGGHNHEWIPGDFNPLTENEQYTPIGYIPEFPSWIVVPLFLATTAVAIAAKKFLTKFR